MSLAHPGVIRIGVATDETGRATSIDLQSSRPTGVGRLFVDRKAQEVPDLARALFGLCGFSHGAAARRAIAAACGEPASPDDDIGVAAERLSESLRATILEWPGEPVDKAAVAAPLREAMVASRAFMTGGPRDTAEALARIEGAVAGCGLPTDAAEAEGFFGAMLREARAEAPGVLQAPDALTPTDDAAVIHLLRDGGARFAALPVLPGRVVETGAYARHWREAIHEEGMLAGRLAARFLDIREALSHLRRLCADGDSDGAAGGSCGAGEGYAAVETARGRLYHWVALDAERRIQAYEMLAPTEWNFHPAGPFAAALRGAEVGEGAAALRRVARLAAVFDPCVAFEIAIRESVHA